MGDEVSVGVTFCATLVDEWARAGFTDAVVCPGSRSTPMALALAGDDRVRVHVHPDERSGAFLALGISLASGRPAAVLTTSGTATANLFPAVAEADRAAVPLLALTADRPPEVHGRGAPQTIDQQHLYGPRVRAFFDPGVPEVEGRERWRGIARRAWDSASGALAEPPGPVQINLPFREPLTGRTGELPASDPARRGSGRPPGQALAGLGGLISAADGARVLVVAGPPLDDAEGLLRFCQRWGWPVLVDPRTPITGARGIRRFDAVLRVPEFVERARPDVVLRIGSPPASKALQQWLDEQDALQIGVDAWGRVFDPGWSTSGLIHGQVARLVGDLDAALARPAPSEWMQLWSEADRLADAAISRSLPPGSLTEPLVARLVTAVAGAHGAALVASSSMPVRDVEWYGHRTGSVYANRGANGIDGVVSTAAGVALASRRNTPGGGGIAPVVGLLGDLALLHDSNGLIGLAGREIDLTLVVVDNDGGGIFHFLPQHELLAPERFEQLFGTPHGLDLAQLARAFGVPAEVVGDSEGLRTALQRAVTVGGVQVLVVHTDRDENVTVHDRIHATVATELRNSLSRGAPDRLRVGRSPRASPPA